jgi:hypothetical protein
MLHKAILHNILTLVARHLKPFIPAVFMWLAKKISPQFRALWLCVFPLQIGDTVSWQGKNFSILEKRRSGLAYEYKIADLKGINLWLLPLLASNPQLTKNAPVFWYKGYGLKKTGHPELRIKLAV